MLPPGAIANQFQAFEDRPMNWDAWDVDIFFDDKLWTSEPAHVDRVVESGPLLGHARDPPADPAQRLRAAHLAGLQQPAPRLRDTMIDWHERHVLLKVAFPVDILSPVGTYEIQWGNVQRPTHRNTSWDWARFETCAQKWVDLSEGDYGVSLLNDCKYGHDIRDNVIRISLLRSPTYARSRGRPGRAPLRLQPAAARGQLERDDYRRSVRAQRSADRDARRRRGEEARSEEAKRRSDEEVDFSSPHRVTTSSLLSVDRPNIVVETIKRAEDGQGIIIRCYESQRQRGEVTLTASFPLSSAWQTNLLEENHSALIPTGHSVTFFVKPYQIVTLRLVPATNDK